MIVLIGTMFYFRSLCVVSTAIPVAQGDGDCNKLVSRSTFCLFVCCISFFILYIYIYCFLLQTKICPFLRQAICIFLMKDSCITAPFCSYIMAKTSHILLTCYFETYQYAYIDFYIVNALKQHATFRHVIPMEHLILTAINKKSSNYQRSIALDMITLSKNDFKKHINSIIKK